MTTVHALWGGLPLCGFSQERPQEWPKDHVWYSLTMWPPSDEELEINEAVLCDACDATAITMKFTR